MKTRLTMSFAALVLLLLAGCAEYKEYYFKDFQISREDAYNSVVAVLNEQGYEVVKLEEIPGNEPEVYLESGWNMRQTDSPYPGNNVRRRAYVRLITTFTDRRPKEFQPLAKADKPMTPDEVKTFERDETARKMGNLEITRVGVAVRREKRNDVRSPMEIMDGDWVYLGPDTLATEMILGDLDILMGDRRGAGEPSERSLRARRDRLAAGGGGLPQNR